MLKKITVLLLALILPLSLALTAHAMEQEDLYTALQEELHARLNGADGATSFGNLVTQFGELGSYKKSSQFRSYCAILADAEAGSFATLSRYVRLLRLDAAFCTQLTEDGYPSVDEIEAYALGRQAEAAQDWNAAIAHYERSIAVMDSLARLDVLIYEHANLLQTGVAIGDFVVETYDNGTCVITGYRGIGGDVVIPAMLGGYQVRRLGSGLFNSQSGLTSIVIPEGVTTICEWAFDNCSTLTSVSLPQALTTLDAAAFYGNSSLTGVVIPGNVTIIKDWTFGHCTSLDIATLEGDVTEISQLAFYGCRSLKIINIPDSVSSIGSWAFAGCVSLKSLTLPEDVVFIGEGAFDTCPNLTLHVSEGSYAHQYAIDKNLPYTTY